MENKHKNLLNTLSKYSDAEWIDFIKRILLNLPLQIEIGLIQDYPEKILDSLNKKKVTFFIRIWLSIIIFIVL